MFRNLKKVLPVFVFLAAAGSASALTFLIDTWVECVPGAMETDRRIGVVSVETGIMDAMFDTGHIFFNVYSIPGEEGRSQDLPASLDHAGEIGARYLVKVVPDDAGVAWELYSARDRARISADYLNLTDTDEELDDLERWMELGYAAADGILAASSPN